MNCMLKKQDMRVIAHHVMIFTAPNYNSMPKPLTRETNVLLKCCRDGNGEKPCIKLNVDKSFELQIRVVGH